MIGTYRVVEEMGKVFCQLKQEKQNMFREGLPDKVTFEKTWRSCRHKQWKYLKKSIPK